MGVNPWTIFICSFFFFPAMGCSPFNNSYPRLRRKKNNRDVLTGVLRAYGYMSFRVFALSASEKRLFRAALNKKIIEPCGQKYKLFFVYGGKKLAGNHAVFYSALEQFKKRIKQKRRRLGVGGAALSIVGFCCFFFLFQQRLSSKRRQFSLHG